MRPVGNPRIQQRSELTAGGQSVAQPAHVTEILMNADCRGTSAVSCPLFAVWWSLSATRRKLWPEAMNHKFEIEIRVSAPGKRGRLRTLVEAHRFITNDIPAELTKLPRWTFALDLIDHASRTGKRRDIEAAGRQLKQALSNEGWLALEPSES
jgi:hypothetical protein